MLKKPEKDRMIRSEDIKNRKQDPRIYDARWVFYEGKWITKHEYLRLVMNRPSGNF